MIAKFISLPQTNWSCMVLPCLNMFPRVPNSFHVDYANRVLFPGLEELTGVPIVVCGSGLGPGK